MRTNKELIIERFREVEKLGYVPSLRRKDTGIGKTFEDYVGVTENNRHEPDLFGFEIKSQREQSSSYITLFTKAPTFIEAHSPKERANSYLRNRYGVPYEENPALKKLHVSMFASKYSLAYGTYKFRLVNDENKRVIWIGVYNPDDNREFDMCVGYTYADLEKALKKKLKNLFYVSAETIEKDGLEMFHFNKAKIYTDPTIDNFIRLLCSGHIMFDMRIGSYGSGKNYGKIHDHGSGFRIQEKNLKFLYGPGDDVSKY